MNLSFSRRLTIVILMTVSLCGAAGPCVAWGDGGHMLVAYYAYENIKRDDPHARSEIDRLLAVAVPPAAAAVSTVDFVNASHWADDVKHGSDYAGTDMQHYVDFPFSVDGTPLPGDLPKDSNLLKALSNYVAVLQSMTSSDQDKAVALRFVIHLVGDLHQPLHCATRVSSVLKEGDEGGNGTMVHVVLNGKASRIALHSFWDRGLGSFPTEGAHFTPPVLNEIEQAAKDIAARQVLPAGWSSGGAFEYGRWAHESEQFAKDFAYKGISNEGTPSAAYIKGGTAIAEQRVLVAGQRLANLLEAIWPPSP